MSPEYRSMLRVRLKWLFFPGMNLHARQRWRELPRWFGSDDRRRRRVLDAGCGNGMLSYQSWLRGNRVVAVSIKPEEVDGCRRLFNGFLGIPEDEMSFQVRNLYEIDELGLEFDEVICSEVLEHIRDDHRVCASFYRILKPGGVLHLCCPNADHPFNRGTVLDKEENGGHVRPGYTLKAYRELLEPLGFRIDMVKGLGGPIRQFFNSRMIALQRTGHHMAAGFLFAMGVWMAHFDPDEPKMPYSLYVYAVKAGDADRGVDDVR